MSKNIIIIIAIAVLILLAIGFFVLRPMLMQSGNYQQNLNGTQTYSNNDGSVTVGENATMPEQWPSDAPANFAGAKIVYSGNANPTNGKAGAVVSYTVSGTLSAVAEYYKSDLKAKGWTIEGDANLGTQMVIGAKKDNRTFGVSIADNGDGTVSVTAGLEL